MVLCKDVCAIVNYFVWRLRVVQNNQEYHSKYMYDEELGYILDAQTTHGLFQYRTRPHIVGSVIWHFMRRTNYILPLNY